MNDKFVVKIVRIEKPSLMSFTTLDFFLMNVESDMILTDTFGYELLSKNKDIKSLLKKNKERLLIEPILLDLTFKTDAKVVSQVIIYPT